MQTIEIDFDVFKALTARRTGENITHNDVLRELLNLSSKKEAFPAASETSLPNSGWTSKGVMFPNGTEFRARHKGKMTYGKVESGSLVVNGKPYDSPSTAAKDVTATSINGWIFWECRMPGESSWKVIKGLREQ
jgi:hypothetical protein